MIHFRPLSLKELTSKALRLEDAKRNLYNAEAMKGMTLAKALRIEPGAVVSFVGAGGKTSSMFRLASELSSAGFRVLTTTTTHISEDQAGFAPASIGWHELGLLKARLDQHGHCLLIGPPDGKGRVLGASSELIGSLHERPDIDFIIVEADGSRSRPFKAPGDHEPVVPESTTVLVPIAGVNSIGQPLDEDHTHRSGIISSIAGQPLGSTITATTLARVLADPRGGAKRLPERARLVPMLNKADTDTSLRQAEEAAEQLMANATVDSVLLSSMAQDPPVRETWAATAGIFLAAGALSQSESAHFAQTAREAGLDPAIVVLGYDAETVKRGLARAPVQIVVNREFEAGQSTFIRKGIDALPSRTAAAMFIFAGRPLVTASRIKDLVQAHRRTLAPACVPVLDGECGDSVLFDKSLFGELRELQGDIGGQVLLQKYRNAVVFCG